MKAPSLPRSAVLIVNARSRRGRALFRHACAKLKAAGITLTGAHPVHDPKDFAPTVKAAVASGAPMVIVGGGDGSLSSAVDFFVGRETVFALLPLGTANSFARSMRIPLDLDGAVEVIARGVPRRIDLGMIDGDYFANAAAIGLAPMVAETVPHGLKAVFGRLGYLGWALAKAARYEPFRLTVGEGPSAETMEALEVRIANGGHHGGAELVESADVESGEIVVQVVTGHHVGRLGWNYAASLLKLPHRHETVREFRGPALRIEAQPPQDISIDGEVLARTPVTARIAARVIAVAAPAPQPEG